MEKTVLATAFSIQLRKEHQSVKIQPCSYFCLTCASALNPPCVILQFEQETEEFVQTAKSTQLFY
jgi:hypothetical protein